MEIKYSKSEFEVNSFIAEIGELKEKISGFKHVGNLLTVYLDFELSAAEKSNLDGFVENHIPNMMAAIVLKTVEENKAFANNMLERMKKKNILEGLNSIEQAVWLHYRLRKTEFTLSDENIITIDVMNLVVSGDIETAEVVLGQMVADDMSQPYHWLNQERIDWIRGEIRTYLGWPQL